MKYILIAVSVITQTPLTGPSAKVADGKRFIEATGVAAPFIVCGAMYSLTMKDTERSFRVRIKRLYAQRDHFDYEYYVAPKAHAPKVTVSAVVNSGARVDPLAKMLWSVITRKRLAQSAHFEFVISKAVEGDHAWVIKYQGVPARPGGHSLYLFSQHGDLVRVIGGA
jgi:hypothetical protein